MILAPYVALAIVATVSVIAVATFAFIGIYSVVKKIQAHNRKEELIKEQTQKQESILEQSPLLNSKLNQSLPDAKPEANATDDSIEANAVSENSITNISNQQQIILPSLKKYTGFFDNMSQLLQPIDGDELAALVKGIKKYEKKIIAERNGAIDTRKEDYIWSEGPKRQNKIDALNFLKDFIKQLDDILRKNKITIGGHNFEYQSINQLVFDIDKRITDNFPKAYQSFFKNVGGVETLFKQAYKILLAREANQNREIANDLPANDKHTKLVA